MSKLHDLFRQQGQSPWIDNLKRPYLTSGHLAGLVRDGIRGVTSNPTIFQKAIAGQADYDAEFERLLKRTASIDDVYWTLVVSDVVDALSVLRPVYEESSGTDGFVSLEVSPALADDTAGTEASARDLHTRISLPNLMVKIPATEAGVPAIRSMIAEGRNTNVTLIFSLERYDAVIEAYLSGLEAFPGDVSTVQSVASFFVSRVDTEVDRRLDGIGTDEALALRGKAAVAQAKLAYKLFRERFSGPRWEALAERGANLQRPLWASTSTKNPDYPDTLYIDSLIGPDTVNTIPDATVDAWVDHGMLARTVDVGVDEAQATFDALARIGVDVGDVARVLETEGVASFAKSFDELMSALQAKANDLSQ